ncbi:tetratricopeptide repeat protein [Devosia psychrophila]|nr:tetratricopeptide repeat protein [Devosia psychrophila]
MGSVIGRLIELVVVGLVLSVPPVFAQAVNDKTAATCDQLASSPLDPAVPVGTGVKFDDLDAGAAIVACASAVEANPDNAKLRFQLARSYDVAEQFDKAIAEYRVAADQGYALALSSLGSLYEGGYGLDADPAAAARLYEEAAGAGVVVAMENLAKLYEDGRSVTQDYDRAVELYRQAAEAGSPYASGSLGWLAENGFGMPQDDVEAARLYQIAADGGEAFAQHNIGVMYAKARGGLTQSDVEAVKYFNLAAEQQWPPSYQSLGWHYSQGAGVSEDLAKAEEYFRLAIAEGDKNVRGDASNDLAWMFATESIRLDEAEQLARQAVDAGPEMASRIDTLAWVLHVSGRHEDALPFARKAVALEGDNAIFADHLAEIEAALGK